MICRQWLLLFPLIEIKPVLFQQESKLDKVISPIPSLSYHPSVEEGLLCLVRGQIWFQQESKLSLTLLVVVTPHPFHELKYFLSVFLSFFFLPLVYFHETLIDVVDVLFVDVLFLINKFSFRPGLYVVCLRSRKFLVQLLAVSMMTLYLCNNPVNISVMNKISFKLLSYANNSP